MNVLTFHELAKLELNEAAEYYNSESPGLGHTFITAVERCTEEIVQYPEAGPEVRGSIRRRLIRRFAAGVPHADVEQELADNAVR